MPAAIEVRGLRKTYGDLHAVDGIDFTVREGEVFAFLGPNGAGKTTTVEILEGLRKRTDGEVRVLGFDPWTEATELHRHTGVIPQDFRFFDKIHPKEAVEYYGVLFGTNPDPMTILKRVGLADKADTKYDTLSGGQKQKLGLALALTNDPKVCFLDEPTTGLDPQARRTIWDVIRQLRDEGRTVFLTTHYLEEAELLADQVAIIDHGRIIAGGTPAEIIDEHGRPERLKVLAPASLAIYLHDRLGVAAKSSDGRVEIPIEKKGDVLRVLTAIEASGIPWEGFATETDTLEDVFVAMVGRMDEGEVKRGGAR